MYPTRKGRWPDGQEDRSRQAQGRERRTRGTEAARRPRPAKRPAEAETGTKEFGGAYSDPSRRTVGVYDARRQFEGAHGNPSPRQKAMRGENVVPKSATEGPFPAPLD
jgi:hypothetical protein